MATDYCIGPIGDAMDYPWLLGVADIAMAGFPESFTYPVFWIWFVIMYVGSFLYFSVLLGGLCPWLLYKHIPDDPMIWFKTLFLHFILGGFALPFIANGPIFGFLKIVTGEQFSCFIWHTLMEYGTFFGFLNLHPSIPF